MLSVRFVAESTFCISVTSPLNRFSSAFNNELIGGPQQPPFDTTNLGDMNQFNQQQFKQDTGAFGGPGLADQQMMGQQPMGQQPMGQQPMGQQQMTQQQQQPQKPKDMFCPMCRISILMPSSEIENKCADCGQVVCKNCGMHTQSQFNEVGRLETVRISKAYLFCSAPEKTHRV